MKTKTAEQYYFESRQKVPKKHRWNLEKMYTNLSAWQKHFDQISKKVAPLSRYRGKLKQEATILEYFRQASSVLRELEKLYVYASHLSSTDLSNHQALVISQKAQDLYTKFSQTVSFQGPELSQLPEARLKKMSLSAEFRDYHRELKLILAKKKHILSDAEEGLLSMFSRLFTGPEDVFSALDNVDLTFAEIKDAKGKKHQLTSSNFTRFLENTDRPLRHQAFENFYKSYQSHINTYAQTLNLCVKQHHLYATAKKYSSALEASLSGNMIDPEVYRALIRETHKSLPVLHKYFALRANKLGLKKFNMWDLRVNIANSTALKFTWDEAVDICLNALRPLGEEYVKTLRSGLTTGGWVDRFENKGKRSGAFSGGCYDSEPYILMNFTGTLNDVYTLIHEAGHSMHSWLSRHNQPYPLADYSLFVAEIASTVNERLLTSYLLENFTGKKREIVLAYEVDAIRATYFRQTMFAEFELDIHEQVEKGEPLTVQYFNQTYDRLNSRYYGPQLEHDQYIQYEWARIPHFYYNFYVYQYATGIAAAYCFADRITDPAHGGKAAAAYLDFLRSGGNDFPLLQLKRAGLDFVKPDLYRAVAKNLQKCLNLLEN
jgi:oligoendopeptidase F